MSVKLWPQSQTITFIRKGRGLRSSFQRGMRLSKAAFEKMEDVSIAPGVSIILENNVELSYFSKSIKLVRYCMSKDSKRCEGNFVIFSEKDWQNFWNNIRPAALNAFKQ